MNSNSNSLKSLILIFKIPPFTAESRCNPAQYEIVPTGTDPKTRIASVRANTGRAAAILMKDSNRYWIQRELGTIFRRPEALGDTVLVWCEKQMGERKSGEGGLPS
jgi:hypothetical protein